MKIIVLALSGGVDSTTLLDYFCAQGTYVHVCLFKYNSKHNALELTAAQQIVKEFQKRYPEQIQAHTFDLRGAFMSSKSSLLHNSTAIPEGHYTAENMRSTVVPGRNLVFAAYLGSLAESIGACCVALGVHAGDHAIYPDCRPSFIEALDKTIQHSTDAKVHVITPFLHLTKAEIVAIGLRSKIPYHLTRTCYTSEQIPCGKCGSCVERAEAFQLNGIIETF